MKRKLEICRYDPIRLNLEGLEEMSDDPIRLNLKGLEEMSDVLECRVCAEPFSQQGDHIPRLLQCGHTVCHLCLTKLPIQDSVLLCPFDRQQTLLGSSSVWSLKKNFALLELLERLHVDTSEKNTEELEHGQISGSNSPVFACDEDENHIASLFCTVCLSNLCKDCSAKTHQTRTLMKHKRVPISEKPQERPRCQYHTLHFVEFTCMEKECAESPLCCFICKDYGRHKGHMHGLIETEAEKLRLVMSSAVLSAKQLVDQLSETVRKLELVANQIEGVSTSSGSERLEDFLIGTGEVAHLQVQTYFAELHELLKVQENAALIVVDTHVREKLSVIRQNHEDLGILASQVSEAVQHFQRLLFLDDTNVVSLAPSISRFLSAIQEKQTKFSELRQEQLDPDPSIHLTFTKNNRVQIGPKIEFRVIILGLDGAGKTSILFKLKQDEFIPTIPTIGFNVETVDYGSMKLTLWDVGGGQKLRPLWKHYYLNTQAVIFVVDSCDCERLPEACAELVKIANEKELRHSVLLILANKQDLPGAASVEELTEALSLSSLFYGQSWHMQACDTTSGTGFSEALHWLARQLVSPGSTATL